MKIIEFFSLYQIESILYIFEMKLPARRPLVYGELTKEQFDAEIQKGMDDAASGKVYSADDLE